MNKIKLNDPCFFIKDGRVIEGKLSDFSEFIPEFPTPAGIGPKYHIVYNDAYKDEGGYVVPETYSVGKHNHTGGPEIVPCRGTIYKTEADAQAELEAIHARWIMLEAPIFLSKQEAEASLSE